MQIPLTHGQVATVDQEDFLALSAYRWNAVMCNEKWYAIRSSPGRGGPIYMHRAIAGANRGQRVDHRNGDGLDNTRRNLRLCNQSQNLANCAKHRDGSSRFKGVSWDKKRNKWFASITINYRQKALGRYEHEEDAARAYDSAAELAFGEFSRINLSRAA